MVTPYLIGASLKLFTCTYHPLFSKDKPLQKQLIPYLNFVVIGHSQTPQC